MGFGIAILMKLWHCVVLKGGEEDGREAHGLAGYGSGGAVSACVFRHEGIRPPVGRTGTGTDRTQREHSEQC